MYPKSGVGLLLSCRIDLGMNFRPAFFLSRGVFGMSQSGKFPRARERERVCPTPVSSWTTALRRPWRFVGLGWGVGWGGACTQVRVNLHMK